MKRKPPHCYHLQLHQKYYLEKDRPILISAFLFTSEALWPKLLNNNFVKPTNDIFPPPACQTSTHINDCKSQLRKALQIMAGI